MGGRQAGRQAGRAFLSPVNSGCVARWVGTRGLCVPARTCVALGGWEGVGGWRWRARRVLDRSQCERRRTPRSGDFRGGRGEGERERDKCVVAQRPYLAGGGGRKNNNKNKKNRTGTEA